MKNNDTRVVRSLDQLLFNPFNYIAGYKSLFIGILILIISSLLGYFSQTHFNGIIDVHYDYFASAITFPYINHLGYQLISWVSLTLVMYVAALITSKSSVRLVDMAGTLAMARTPLLLATFIGFIPFTHQFPQVENVDKELLAQFLHDNIVVVLLFIIVIIAIVVWAVVLLYNAFSVSGNLKGTKGKIVFTIALLISEIISKILIYNYINKLI